MSANARDIEKIASSEQQLRALINNTEQPIWLVDNNLIILECNSAFKKWVNYFIGQELSEGDHVLHNGINRLYHEKFEMCYQLALAGRAFKSVEDMKIDGETHYTHVSFNPVMDANQKIVGVSCFAHDITEQRQHLYKIEEQNTALREIAFIESHKVRGSVATIMGLEQLFNYNNPADPLNTEIMEGLKRVIYELDGTVREVVKKSNAIEA